MNEIIKKGWNINWAASAHPKNILSLNFEELKLIKKSGCSRILIGAESGNEDELKYIKKNVTSEQVMQTAEVLGKMDIHGSFTVIVGYPGFPEKNIENTLNFSKKIKEINYLHEIKAHIYAPYPGTPLYNEAIKFGFKEPETLEAWSQYDYYSTQTPWLKNELTEEIRKFNKEYCPYVL